MLRPRPSLRRRLAVAGFFAIYTPVLIVAAVGRWASEDVNVVPGSDVEQVTTRSGVDSSPWLLATVIALAPIAAWLSWWWAGRAVRPLITIRDTTEQIQSGNLDTRLDLDRGPREVVELAASFDRMLDRLESATDTQHRLIEETSHELRTPLAVLSANADVLLDHPDPSVDLYAEGLRRSRRAAERLAALIDELLVDARGRARLIDRVETDLVALVEDAVDSMQSAASARRVSIRVTAPSPLSASVDRSSMLRAVTNLLDNAIRYAPVDSIVEVAVRRDGALASLSVEDHGPGIAPADQQRIFERFASVDPQSNGVGLGLPIARHTALAHGGTIDVASPIDEGRGARFTMEFPIIMEFPIVGSAAAPVG